MSHYHKHHIVPKHSGGTNDPSNLVRLTIEEHAQAHLDLYEKYGDERDLLAHRTLLGQITNAEAISILRKLPKTEQHKKKISEALKGENNPMYGKKPTEETRKKLSEASMGNKHNICNQYRLGKSHTEETKEKMRAAMIGRTLTEEHKTKISESRLGKPQPQSQKNKVSKALSKQWEITDPEGNVFVIENLNKFAKYNNLDQGNLA